MFMCIVLSIFKFSTFIIGVKINNVLGDLLSEYESNVETYKT